MRRKNTRTERWLMGWSLGIVIIVAGLIMNTLPNALARGEETIHHALKVELQPGRSYLRVEDEITIPEKILKRSGRKVHFSLLGSLHPLSLTQDVKILIDEGRHTSGVNRPEKIGGVPVGHYAAILPAGRNTLKIAYKGRIIDPIDSQRRTTGLILQKGAFLAGSTLWVPWFDENPITFTLDVEFPSDWEVLSQGKRTARKEKVGWISARWEATKPQDEIYLIGSRYTEYSDLTGKVPVMIFLRTPDDKLANRYLLTGQSYLKMYESLLGPYPHEKFAVAENFWETGYGMPSFTLLGSSVIRLPFILHSSYPHEILHNWWGNGVFVHYERGNWSEGLTAYMADHLVQEQRGLGAEYRRTTLQKYADYVSENNDFPLTGFRMRHNPATAAVGYGKTMMFFHMLRGRLGDKIFVKALRKFYHDYKFQRADFDDLLTVFSDVSGQDLTYEFDQWVRRKGAPILSLVQAVASKDEKGDRLTIILEQKQPGPVYRFRVPLAVQLKGTEKTHQLTVEMHGRRDEFILPLPAPPTHLVVDPEFDVFRRLDRRELPPALSQSFGAEKILVLIPTNANRKTVDPYKRFAISWGHFIERPVEVKRDNEIEALPSDRTVWILGWENRFLQEFKNSIKKNNVRINSLDLRIGENTILHDNHSSVLVSRHPDNPESTLVLLVIGNAGAVGGLLRKLPHYGRYSYAAFEGKVPANILKGRWAVTDSPLSIHLDDPLNHEIPEMKLAPRPALIERPE